MNLIIFGGVLVALCVVVSAQFPHAGGEGIPMAVAPEESLQAAETFGFGYGGHHGGYGGGYGGNYGGYGRGFGSYGGYGHHGGYGGGYGGGRYYGGWGR